MATTQKSYTIPLRKSFLDSAPLRRAPRAVKAVKSYLKRHCKVDEVKLGAHLNQSLWTRGIRHPPARVSVNVSVEDGVAKAELEGHSYVEAPKPVAKEEPESLKDKVASKIGAAKASDAAEASEGSAKDEPPEQPSKEEAPAKKASQPSEDEAKPSAAKKA